MTEAEFNFQLVACRAPTLGEIQEIQYRPVVAVLLRLCMSRDRIRVAAVVVLADVRRVRVHWKAP
jgi:hypothetical protein